MALISEVNEITPSQLSRASAALQKQLTRDFSPIWGMPATIDAFANLDDVPLTYWPILIQQDIHTNAGGVHLDKSGQPFALVRYSNQWTLTASHEMLEMSADPFGNRLIQSRSVKSDQGRVEYLVEVCDPSEAGEFGYHVNGVLVADFYTPHFFDPVKSSAVRYSFTGAISQPRQVLRGGYLSWHNPPTNKWWQQLWLSGNKPIFKNLGTLDASKGSLRSQIDGLTPVPGLSADLADQSNVLTATAKASEEIDASTSARADQLRIRISEIKKAAGRS